MKYQRIVATAVGAALSVTFLAVPRAEAAITTPPPGTNESCNATLSTSAHITGGPQFNVAHQGVMSIGIQNFGSSNAANWRPWIRMYGLAERQVHDTQVTFTQNAPAGNYSVATQPNGLFATVPVTNQFEPSESTIGGNGSFTATPGEFNALGGGWGANTRAAMWLVNGPANTLPADQWANTTSTLRADTVYFPVPAENDSCVPLQRDSSGVRAVASTGTPQLTGAAVTNGEASDFSRISGTVSAGGVVIPGATATVNPDGRVLITLPAGYANDSKAVAVQLQAGPHAVLPKNPFPSYTTPVNIGGSFEVPLVTQTETNAPVYESTEVAAGGTATVTAPKNSDGLALPAGTTFSAVDLPGWAVLNPATGEITLTPGYDVSRKDYTFNVMATYPDKSTDDLQAVVTVTLEVAPDWKDVTTTAGTLVVVPNSGASLPTGTTAEVGTPPGWNGSYTDGVVKVSVPAGTALGDYEVTVHYTVPGETTPRSDTFTVTVEASDSPDASSGSSDQCVAAGLTVGLPLLLLAPVGLATQLHIPGIDALTGPIQQQIAAVNTQLQQQSGIYNADLARFAEQFNAQLNSPAGRALGGAALVGAGLLAALFVASSCAPGSGSDGGSADESSIGSSEDLLGSSEASSAFSSEGSADSSSES